MNRRALLAAFAAAPIVAWSRPAPIGPIQKLSRITVCSAGGADFKTIWEALDHAAPGALIFIKASHVEDLMSPTQKTAAFLYGGKG